MKYKINYRTHHGKPEEEFEIEKIETVNRILHISDKEITLISSDERTRHRFFVNEFESMKNLGFIEEI